MASLDWIKQIERSALELDEKPQFGKRLDFSWENFESQLKDVFEVPLSIRHQVKGWIKAPDFFEGIGKNPRIVAIHWSPLETPVFFVTTEQNLHELMRIFLGGEKISSFFYDNDATSAFFDYFAAEILHVIDSLGFAAPLSPNLGQSFESLKEITIDEPCFVVDVTLSVEKANFSGRILVPERLRAEWKKFFTQREEPSLSEEAARKIPLTVSLEIGKAGLKLNDWKSARIGDFIILDQCSFNPETNKGSVLVTLQGKPIFRARFKEGSLKITSYPVYEEENNMGKDVNEENDEDLYGDEELGEDLFKDLPNNKEEKETGEKRVTLNPEELPIQLTVEITRLKMTAKELMNLAPGNLLDLNVSPEQGVDLVANGLKVGRGELIRLGEVLGVRILSL